MAASRCEQYRVLAPGDFFGEVELLTRQRRTSSCKAMSFGCSGQRSMTDQRNVFSIPARLTCRQSSFIELPDVVQLHCGNCEKATVLLKVSLLPLS